VGKADVLLRCYGATELEDDLARRILDCGYPDDDTCPVLVIVIRRNLAFDVALYVDEREHWYWQQRFGEMDRWASLEPLRFLLLTRGIADELAGLKKQGKKPPEKGAKNNEQAKG
jgi:hypothetical protein